MTISRTYRILRSMLPILMLIGGISHSTLLADPPLPSKGKHTVGSAIRLLAMDKSRLYYLLIMQEKYVADETVTASSKALRVPSKSIPKGKVATSACIVVVNKARAIQGAKTVQSRISKLVAGDLASRKISPNLVAELKATLTANLAGDVRVVGINSSQLQRLIGSPALRTGKLAMLSDLPADIAGSISGLGGIALVEISAPGFATVGFSTLLGAGTAAEIAAIAPMVAVAGAGGYATGTAMNGVFTAVLSAATGKSNYTLGDAAYDFFVGDDDTPTPAATTPTDGSTTTTTTPASGGGSGDQSTDPANTAGSGSGEKTEEEKKKEDEEKKKEEEKNTDDDDGSTAEDGTAEEGVGTSLPPDLQSGSPIGTLVLYAVSGLGRGEMQRQLAAIDIVGGGSLGVERQKATNLHWDQMLGGFYLNTIMRGLEARRGKQGGRDRVGSYIQMPDKRMFINGFFCPPLQFDYMKVTAAVGK